MADMLGLVLSILLASSAADARELPFFQKQPLRTPRETIGLYQIPQTQVRPFAAPDRRPEANVPKYYVCPKDGAELKVPAGKTQAALKCPLDGTEMKESAGPDRRYYLLEEK